LPVFDEIIAGVAADHFKPADRVILEQLAVAVFIARELAAGVVRDGVIINGKPNQAARHLRQQQATIATLSTKLRLTTQSRITKRGAASAADSGPMSIAELYDKAMQ
jgi:hypothetical protein